MKIMTISKHSKERGSYAEFNRSGPGRMEIDEEKRLNELIK